MTHEAFLIVGVSPKDTAQLTNGADYPLTETERIFAQFQVFAPKLFANKAHYCSQFEIRGLLAVEQKVVFGGSLPTYE